MKNFLNSNSKNLFFLISFLLSIYASSKILSAIRRRNGESKYSPENLGPDYDYDSYAKKLYNTLNGIGGNRESVLSGLLDFNNDEFIYTYILFNRLVRKNTTEAGELLGYDNETLRDWIDDEIMPFSDIDEKVIERIDKIGLA